jgi:hypothetical protein
LKLRDLLFKNLGWKIGALLLSLALWFHIATEKTYEKQFPVKIEVVRLPGYLKISQIDPPKIDVSYTGSGKQLLQLMISGNILINMDLSLVTRPGEYEFDLTPSEISSVDVSAFRNVTFLGSNRIKVVIEPKS